MKRKLLSIFALLLMTTTAWADHDNSGSCGDNVTWELADGVLTLSGTGGTFNYFVEHESWPWTSFCSEITSVVIDEGVTDLGSQIFYDCNNLTSVSIPSTVTYINDGVFMNCSSLTSVTFTESSQLTNIGMYAFDGCSSLSSISIPSGVTSIDDCAFNFCINLSTISIPSGVTNIGDGAFEGCINLSSVSIPSSVTNIGSQAFSGCTNLPSISIPSGVKSIGTYAFEGCSLLSSISVDGANTKFLSENGVLFNKAQTSIVKYPEGKSGTTYTIPSSVKTIENRAFSGCTSLTSITIPEGVTKIGGTAFENCASLVSMSIPSSVTTIGSYPFRYCSALSSISVDGANTQFMSENGVLFDKEKTKIIKYPEAKSGTAYIIPSGVTSIEDYAFDHCSSLTSVIIPDGITTIGTCAFREATSLTSVIIPTTVTSIGGSSFSGCSSLGTVTIYARPLTTYGSNAFKNNQSGRKIYVFDNCKSKYQENWSSYSSDILSLTVTAKMGETGEYWSTYYNDKANIFVREGTQVFIVELEGESLSLIEVSDRFINRGQGVVLKSTSPTIPLNYGSKASATSYSDNSLQGTMFGITNPGNAYVLNMKSEGVGFYKLKDGGTIGANKAYLVAAAGARECFLFDEATNVDNVRSQMEEGIGDVYDLQGRRVSQPSKGLYIVKGKKVVIK